MSDITEHPYLYALALVLFRQELDNFIGQTTFATSTGGVRMRDEVFDELSYELMEYGLSLNEAKIYVALLKLGRGKASEVSRVSKLPRTEVYRIAKKLRERGFLETAIEKPITFQAMPPNKLLEILLSDMTERASTLAKKRDNLTSKLKSIEGKVELEERIYFSTVVGERGAHEKAVRMCDEAREEILYVTSGFGLRRAVDDGLLESFKRQAHRGVRVRVISEIQESNVKEAKLFLNLCELRHVDQLATHLLIADHTQALVGVSIKGSSPIDSKEHIELWTNNPDYISTMKRFFQELWNNATGGRVKIQSIEAARPMEEFKIIRGRTETLRKIIEMVDNAESEINHITTANGLYRIYQAHYENYEKLREKGVKIRILAPMTEDNVKVAAKLAKFASLRNLAPSSTIRLCLVDNKEMILFEPLPDDPTIDAGLFVAFWNNNKAYVELMKSVFESMWSNASQVHLTD